MEMQRALVKAAIIIFLFVQFGLCRRTGSGLGFRSRTERVALLQLRSSLGIKGKDWPIKAEPCRNWTGVHCHNGRVIAINVTGLKRTRTGRLRPRFAVDSIVNLTHLASFTASGFFLNGSIPEWFGYRVSKLENLDLRSSSLTGSIPSSLGNLSFLKSLLLSHNSLAGNLPSELGRLSGLSVLDLSENSLTGPVPNTLSSLANLTSLKLSSNFLSGSIPPILGTLSNLQILNLSDNALIGSVPPQLGNIATLVALDLSKNSLSGSLSNVLFSKLFELQILILSENNFDGALPATLWSRPNLHFLDVSSNNLTGLLPILNNSSGVNYTNATFNLSNNLFYGTLNSKTLVSKFKKFDLSGNYFQGEVQVGGFGNVTLARNCLRMIPNQRDLRDCRVFYARRSLPFSPSAQDSTQSPLQDSVSRNNKVNKRVVFILVGIFGGLGFIVLLVLVLTLLLKRCGNGHNSIAIQRGAANVGPVPEVESPTPPKDPVYVAGSGMGESFTYEQMLHLTGNFSEANLIKHGHSGDLFWGTLEGGVTVVVKKVDLHLFNKESYMVELGLLSKVSHARLVPLLGHCLENEHEKCIVYKYMPNGDLATSLHRDTCSDDNLQSLDWITRWKIAIGAAEGLSYLHGCNPPLVHRDVQASSILLDDKFEVRLGSLSEVIAQGDPHQSVITRIFCKSSSFDPDNSGSSFSTCAYDVYCFGKVLLELITGNLGVSKSDDATTKEWLEQTLSYISVFDKEKVTKIVDPSLIIDDDLLEEVWAMAIVARSCLNPKPTKRPPMRYVLKALENPVKVVREEYYSSARLRTTSSRRSWSFAIFGSWRQSSLESGSATGHINREGMSSFKQSGRVGSQGSGGNDHPSSHKRSSNEIFPEPLEMLDMERQDEH